MIVKAKLIKYKTDDSMVEAFNHVPLGKIYEVDTTTIRTEWMYNKKADKVHQKEIIDTYPDGGWYPTELLEFEE